MERRPLTLPAPAALRLDARVIGPASIAHALGLGSAVTLAGANTFVKSAKDILGGRAVMALTSAVLMAFPPLRVQVCRLAPARAHA